MTFGGFCRILLLQKRFPKAFRVFRFCIAEFRVAHGRPQIAGCTAPAALPSTPLFAIFLIAYCALPARASPAFS
jgi:hypothetical protein